MKFIIPRAQLIASVQDVMKAISARTAIPILTGRKIAANTHGITSTGSDSDISIESYIPAEPDGVVHVEDTEPGSRVLEARYLRDIIRKVAEDTEGIEP